MNLLCLALIADNGSYPFCQHYRDRASERRQLYGQDDKPRVREVDIDMKGGGGEIASTTRLGGILVVYRIVLCALVRIFVEIIRDDEVEVVVILPVVLLVDLRVRQSQ